MSRRFSDGQSVIVSNPLNSVTEGIKGETFTITYHQTERRASYRLSNGIWVRPIEISAAPVTEVIEEIDSALHSDVVSQMTKEKKSIKVIDFNQLARDTVGFEVGDRVRINFVPSSELAGHLNFDSELTDWLKSDGIQRMLGNYIGQEGELVKFYDKNWMRIRFENGYEEWFPTFGIAITEKSTVLYTFEGSEDREVYVYKDKIRVGGEVYEFELFERLWKAIQAHKKIHGKGQERQFTIGVNGWEYGILRDTHIAVGCQRFPYENVQRLVAAIRVAKSK